MSSSQLVTRRNRASGRSLANVFCCLFAATGLLISVTRAADNNNEPQQVMGKIISIERKGASAKVTVDRYDGGQLDLSWNKASHYYVHFKGDDKFFRKGVWVSTTARKERDSYYADNFLIYVKANLTPYARKDPRSNEWEICGTIVAYDRGTVTISGGAQGVVRVMLDNKALDNIKVAIANPDYVEEGSEVELEGVMRGKKFMPSKVMVKLDRAIPADQAFSKKKVEPLNKGAAPKEKEADVKSEPKGKPVPRGKKQADAQALPNPDPFGVLSGDNAKGKKKKK